MLFVLGACMNVVIVLVNYYHCDARVGACVELIGILFNLFYYCGSHVRGLYHGLL